VKPESIEVPRRRPGAGGAIRSDETVASDLGRPSEVSVYGSHLLERATVGHLGRLALEGEIDAGKLDRDGTSRVLGEVAGLAVPRPLVK
jgi:hypothetical protein